MPWLDFDDEYALKKAQSMLAGTYRPEEWGEAAADKPTDTSGPTEGDIDGKTPMDANSADDDHS